MLAFSVLDGIGDEEVAEDTHRQYPTIPEDENHARRVTTENILTQDVQDTEVTQIVIY